jgi:hypothetical protein
MVFLTVFFVHVLLLFYVKASMIKLNFKYSYNLFQNLGRHNLVKCSPQFAWEKAPTNLDYYHLPFPTLSMIFRLTD